MLSFIRESEMHQPQFEKIYNFRGLLPNTGGKMEELFQDAVKLILEYLKKQGLVIPDTAFASGSFHRKSKDGFVDCMAMKYRCLWAAKVKQIQSSREIIQELALTKTKNGLEFGLQVVGEYIPGQPVADFQPELIFRMADRLGLAMPRGLLDGMPICIDDDSQIDTFYDLVTDPERRFPIVVISEINTFTRRGNFNIPRFLLNAHDLGRHLRGFAFVVQLAFDPAREWGQRMGRGFAVYDGAVRTFYPKRNFIQSSYKDHPGIFKDQIPSYHFKNQQGTKAYFAYLTSAIRKYTATAPIPWDMMYFLPQARQLKEEIDCFAATLPKAVSSRNTKHVIQLQDDLKSIRLELRQKTNLLTELHTQLSDRDKEISELHSQIEYLNLLLAQSASLQKSKQILPAKTEPTVTYGNIAELCRLQYAEKLLLLQRAEHSLSKAQFEFPHLVFQALGILANEYRDWRLGKISQGDFKDKCSKFGITLSTIRRKHNCRAADPFVVNYPPGSQKTQWLQYQLCKGNSKESRYCMRIYFFWSEQDKLVVIGDLPQQLDRK